jgi:DNA invertase Pin-like site-specific DNA recombinase
MYARVSTYNQVQAQTIKQQLERLTEYVAQQGWELQGNISSAMMTGAGCL